MRAAPQCVDRTVPATDGLSLHVVDWGGDGPPLVLVHGYGHNARTWDPFVPDLAGAHRVLAIDNRGHGDSDRDPEFRYHNAAVARDLAAVVDDLGLEAVTLVGHSQGGCACIRFAAKRPECVARLVLVEAGPAIPDAGVGAAPGATRLLSPSYDSVAAYEAILAETYPRLDAAARASLARHALRPGDDGRPTPNLDPRFLARDAKRDAQRRVRFDRAAWVDAENARLWDDLARIACPTLVVRGERSPFLDAATARRMTRDALADATDVAIPGAGHAVMLDEPLAFREALCAFVASDRGAR